MSTLDAEYNGATACAVGLIIGKDDFTVCLADGRRITVPYGCYPRLEHATMRERDHFEVHADGRMLHWPDIDEDIEVQHIVQGRMPVKKGQEFLAVAEGHATYSKVPSPREENQTVTN